MRQRGSATRKICNSITEGASVILVCSKKDNILISDPEGLPITVVEVGDEHHLSEEVVERFDNLFLLTTHLSNLQKRDIAEQVHVQQRVVQQANSREGRKERDRSMALFTANSYAEFGYLFRLNMYKELNKPGKLAISFGARRK